MNITKNNDKKLGWYYTINNKYIVYQYDWCAYNTITGGDVPQYVFNLIKRLKGGK